MPAGDVHNTFVKPLMLIDFRGRLIAIGPAKFEAKRPRQDPYSHGYKDQTVENKHSGLGSLTPLRQRPGDIWG